MKINIKLSANNSLKLEHLSNKLNKDKSKIIKPYLFKYIEYEIEKEQSYGILNIPYQIDFNKIQYDNIVKMSIKHNLEVVDMVQNYVNVIISDLL